MKVVFRVDAGTEMGYGHVMRCLTLAETIRQRGHFVYFICAEIKGHLAQRIKQKGLKYSLIEKSDWHSDAEQTNEIISLLHPDWLIVDHYALDYQWHEAVREIADKIMVIDDLANRRLDGDLLLDTGLGKHPEDYKGLLPANCHVLTGADYALIRGEFCEKIKAAKIKRSNLKKPEKLLINFGGMDSRNLIPDILDNLDSRFNELEFTVIVSSATQNLEKIRRSIKGCRSCRLLLDVDNMAEEIFNADMALGAGGITAYERCVLGLPSIVIPVADNQLHFAAELKKQAVAVMIMPAASLLKDIINEIEKYMADGELLKKLTSRSFALVDGKGAVRVVKTLESLA